MRVRQETDGRVEGQRWKVEGNEWEEINAGKEGDEGKGKGGRKLRMEGKEHGLSERRNEG